MEGIRVRVEGQETMIGTGMKEIKGIRNEIENGESGTGPKEAP